MIEPSLVWWVWRWVCSHVLFSHSWGHLQCVSDLQIFFQKKQTPQISTNEWGMVNKIVGFFIPLQQDSHFQRFNSFRKVGSEIGMSYSNLSIAIVDKNYYTPGICMFHVNFQGCGYLVIISSFRSRLGAAVSPMPRTSYHNNHNLVMFHEGSIHLHFPTGQEHGRYLSSEKQGSFFSYVYIGNMKTLSWMEDCFQPVGGSPINQQPTNRLKHIGIYNNILYIIYNCTDLQ